LLRGRQFKLASGQSIAKKMGEVPLKDSEILIGQGVDHPKPKLRGIVNVAGRQFAGNCPLWTYILAEAMHNHERPNPKIPVRGNKRISTPQLGPVGGRIVAEVFLGLLFSDPSSFLHKNPSWTPREAKSYRLKDLVIAALAA
jgi:hypothetical protein